MKKDVDELLAYCKSNNRICPMPNKWNELWEMLPNRSQIGSGWHPALPLILAAWHHSSGLMKMTRLREHILYAEENGVLMNIREYLQSLREEDWFHIND